MVEPLRHGTALPETEQQVIEGRVLRIVGFNRLVEPERLALPRIERYAARIGMAIEPRRRGQIIPGDIATRRDRRKRIAIAVSTREAADDPAFGLRRTQRVRQIRVEDGTRTDFDKDAIALANQRSGRLGETHRVSDI